MKLFIQYPKDNQTGKGRFFQRIVPHLEALGVKCFYENDKCDITIAPIRFREKTKGIPRVLRVDGIHLFGAKRGRNEIIEHDLRKADAVIWQSEFSRRMATGIFGFTPKTEAVIFNGANPIPRRPEKSEMLRIIMSAKWISDGELRPHKRLKEMLEMVREYGQKRNIRCWVAGKTDMHAEPPIIMLGHLDEKRLNDYLAMSDVMLYNLVAAPFGTE